MKKTKLSIKPEIIIKNDLHDDFTKTIPFPNPKDCLVFLLDDMKGGNKEIMNDGMGKLPYTIDCNPVISFFSKQLQVCFFAKGLLLNSDKKIAVVKYENVKLSYNKIIKVEHWFENYSKNKFHIIRDYWDHSRYDGGPDLRYKSNNHNYIVEYGQLLIKVKDIYVVKIIFSEYEIGKALTDQITGIQKT